MHGETLSKVKSNYGVEKIIDLNVTDKLEPELSTNYKYLETLHKIYNIHSNKYAETMSILLIIRTERLNGLPKKKKKIRLGISHEKIKN